VGRRDLTSRYVLTIAVLKERNKWNSNDGKQDVSIYGKDEAGSASGVDGWYPGPTID
jgi:hypothetical protein